MSLDRIQGTKNYAMFVRSAENRPTDVKKHKMLARSLMKHGFLKCLPIVCKRDKKGRLIVKEGQHRLEIAASLGIEVFWIETDVDFDIAEINCTGKVWRLEDYARKHAANGKTVYQEGIDFAEGNGITIRMAFALLAGTTRFNNVRNEFVAGSFKAKDREWADAVASLYRGLLLLEPNIRGNALLAACMAMCRVNGFDHRRMLAAASGCRGKLVKYAHRDDFLDRFEEIYNHRRGAKNAVPLKFEATKVMRDRSAVTQAVNQAEARKKAA